MNEARKALYCGCGEDRRNGYLHCDVRKLPGLNFICNAWEVSKYVRKLTDIYTRHMLEHLTAMEVQATLLDWYKALAIGGKLYIVVPNLDFHIQQWLNAKWNETSLKNKKSNARYGFAGFYGWQRECDPRKPDYNSTYWDVHKSGYNEKNLAFLLKRAGYLDVHTEVKNQVHLVATAIKPIMHTGERQISPDYHNIRADHKNRYRFAGSILSDKKVNKILDLACGIGYGSKMLANQTAATITAVDIDKGTIKYAHQYYSHPNVKYIQGDAGKIEFDHQFDAIVSFETIEHIEFDKDLLSMFFDVLKPGGQFICSTPNQDFMPFNPKKFPFHIKHYTNDELVDLVQQTGFSVAKVYKQNDKKNGEVLEGDNGIFTILVCKKPT